MQMELQDLPDDLRTDLESYPNVVGTGIGPKQTDTEGITDEESVIVFVQRKLPEDELDADAIVPAEVGVEGTTYPTDVQEAGDVRMLELQRTAEEVPTEASGREIEPEAVPPTMSRTERWRPAPAGVSIGHPDVTAGTLGTPPLRTEGEELVFLTNSHVAAKSGAASKGDPIIQPGAFDGGSAPDDGIGTLLEFNQISTSGVNETDSAIVEITPDTIEADIFELYEDLREFTEATVGEVHTKSGRTTGVTSELCIARKAKFNVRYSKGTATFDGLDVFRAMAAGGDSGSLIGFERQDGFYGTSLLFAGSSSVTLGIPMSAVQDFHGTLTPVTSQDLVDPDDLRVTGSAMRLSLGGGATTYRWSGPWADRYVLDFRAVPATGKGWVRSEVESVYRTSRGLYYLLKVQNRKQGSPVDCDVRYTINR